MKKMHNSIVENKKVFIGLEDSKRTWKINARSEGIVVNETSMPARYAVLQSYLRNRYPGCIMKLIYEAGFKGFTLHDKLVADGYECIVTPPHRVTQEKGRRVKTDKIDARRLAQNLENGDYSSCFVPDKELREDRQISRTLIQIQKDITRTKNRIRKFFDFHGYDEELSAGEWYDRDYDEVNSLISKLPEPLQFSMSFLMKQLDFLNQEKRRFREKLKELSKKERYNAVFELLRSAPGVGWFTAIRLVLEWGEDLSRFHSAKEFASFTGLTGSEYSTGETEWKGSITRQGPRHIRAWLIECAWTAYKRDSALLQTFMSVYRSSGKKKKAIVAVARKLAVRLRAIVLSKAEYRMAA
jgi:transposase